MRICLHQSLQLQLSFAMRNAARRLAHCARSLGWRAASARRERGRPGMHQAVILLCSLSLSADLAAGAALPDYRTADEAVLRRVANAVLKQTTRRLIDRRTGETFTASRDLPLRASITIESKFNAWFYQTWLLTEGMRRTAIAVEDPAYRDYGELNLAFLDAHLGYFERQHAAGFKAAPVGDGVLSPIGFYFHLNEPWHTGLAPLVVERYAATRDPRYEPYLARVAEFLARSPHLPDGTLYRSRGCLMGDDPYMVLPYLARMYRLTGDVEFIDCAAQQVLGTLARLRQADSGLFRHGWDVNNGCPVGEIWGRANGWFVLAEVELLSALPAGHPRRAEAVAAFASHASALQRVQDSSGGWHQLLDHPESWVETSCTAMFVYGLARGLNEGWLDGSFEETARRSWKALMSKVSDDGDVVDVSGSTDIGDVAYYLKRPRVQGDLHGFGPFLLAGGEMIRLQRKISNANKGAIPREQ